MLYLDLITQEGGQVYLDIFTVEPLRKRSSSGFSLQGVLGDGYAETPVLVEYLDAEVTLTFIEKTEDWILAAGAECEDLTEDLRQALQRELAQAGVWLAANFGTEENSMTCSLLAGDRWYGTAPHPAQNAPVPGVKETAHSETFRRSCGVERCFLSDPAVKKVQNRKRSLHAHPCSRLNQPLSTATLATAGAELSGRSAPVQGISRPGYCP